MPVVQPRAVLLPMVYDVLIVVADILVQLSDPLLRPTRREAQQIMQIKLAPMPRRRVPVTLLVSSGFLILLVAVALLAPWITPFDPAEFVFNIPFHPWDGAHLLGGDYIG